MTSVLDEIRRIQSAKTDIEEAIEYCGVNIPDTALIDTYASYIKSIPDTLFTTLNYDQIGGDDFYIKTIKQSNGLINATTGGCVSSTSSGLAPKIGTSAASTISAQDNEWVLTSTQGGSPTWRKLPNNAFENDNTNTTYALSGALSANTYITTLTDSASGKTTATIPAMSGASSTAAGTAGLVPAPAANKHTAFLRGDGTWVVPTNYYRPISVNGTSILENNNTALNLVAGANISITAENSSGYTGKVTITNTGVHSTTINGNYLRVNTNGTNADLTIPYATSAGSLGGYNISNFMVYADHSEYVAASFTDENLSKKAAEKYIEYWDNAGGWFNSTWGKVTAHNGFVGNLTGTASYATSAGSIAWANVSGKPSFATVATSGSYNDLSNKPSIPTVTDYYWADVKVSASSSTSTTPTFTKWTTSDLNLVSDTNGGKDLGMKITGKSNSIGFIIGSGNINRGIYDYTNSSWILHKNSNNNLILTANKVGIGTDNPNYALDVVGSGKFSTALNLNNQRFNYGLAYYNVATGTVTGTIVITLPNGWNSSMNTYEIDLYEYNSHEEAVDNKQHSKIIISGYNYSGGYWVNYGYQQLGSYNKGVRLGYNGSKCCILLGTTTTTWIYPQVHLSRVITGYSNQTTWSTGYSIGISTNESGYSEIVSLNRTRQRFDDVVANNFRGNLVGNATTANGSYCVYDYNSTSMPIYIGCSGASLTADNALFLAAYGKTSSGSYCIKDISAAEAKKFIGLGNVQNTAFYKRSTTVNGTSWDMAGTINNAAFTIYAPTTAGTSGQVLTSTAGIPGWTNQSSLSAGYLKIHDIRGNNYAPNSTDWPMQNIKAWFNNTGTPNGEWWSGITVKGWTDDYNVWQLASTATNHSYAAYGLFFRTGNGSNWTNWKNVVTSESVKNIVVTSSLPATKVNNTIYILI